MVYNNGIKMAIPEENYKNPLWRARHHYKEEHTPDPPMRRNRDFKPVPYGSAKGILNFRHSEPFCLLKNIKDLVHEDHNNIFRNLRAGINGTMFGGLFGMLWFMGGNTGNWEMNKLMAASGVRPFSFRGLR